MDELYYEWCQQMLFFRKIEYKNRVETIYVGFFQHKSTNEMLKAQYKAIVHIFKYEISSNYVIFKPCWMLN
jgi:hypothetical protein